MLQGNVPHATVDFTSAVVASHVLAFTHDQYHQLLALIGSCSTQQLPQGPEPHVANVVALPTNAVVDTSINFKHSLFFAKIVNRRAYGLKT